MKRFLLLFDSFKGTMSADEVCAAVGEGVRAAIPDAAITSVPLSDGGEGLVSASLRIFGGTKQKAAVRGPFGAPVEAEYALLPSGSAVLEMAACAGLPLAEASGGLDPLRASTYGVGELLLSAAERGAKRMVLGLGGSATNDCGAGMAAALGFRFFDAEGREVPPFAEALGRIARIERPTGGSLLPVTAVCDVKNPLCGVNGASFVFGPQKGARPEQLPLLDANLANMGRVMEQNFGMRILDVPGAGAAGGMGAAALAFLSARLLPGIAWMLDAAGVEEKLTEADCVFTGEGRLDGQSAQGKLISGVAACAKKHDKPCIALCGALGDGWESILRCGVRAAYASSKPGMSMDEIKKSCVSDLRALAERVARGLAEG